ncbi:MAG: hypothetical protein WCA37_06520, partial [Terracidiphilus sp.]
HAATLIGQLDDELCHKFRNFPYSPGANTTQAPQPCSRVTAQQHNRRGTISHRSSRMQKGRRVGKGRLIPLPQGKAEAFPELAHVLYKPVSLNLSLPCPHGFTACVDEPFGLLFAFRAQEH